MRTMVNVENNDAIHNNKRAHNPATQTLARQKACPDFILRTGPKVVHLGRTPETEQNGNDGGKGKRKIWSEGK